MASSSGWLWPSWPWANRGSSGPARPADAAHDPALRNKFVTLLDNTDPPASFKASEVAQSLTEKELAKLGYARWEEAMPAILELAFELRAFGDLEILKQNRVVPDDVMAHEIQGGVRIRRRDGDETILE